jgi:hypothetical protein
MELLLKALNGSKNVPFHIHVTFSKREQSHHYYEKSAKLFIQKVLLLRFIVSFSHQFHTRLMPE